MDTTSVPPEAASVSPGALVMTAFGAAAVYPPAFTFPGSASAAFNPADLGGLGTSSSYGSVAAVLNPAASNRVGFTAAAVAVPVDLSIGVCASRKRKGDESGFKTHTRIRTRLMVTFQNE